MTPVRFTPAAERDIAEAAEWYSKRNRSLAGRFIAAVRETTQRIAEQPESFQIAVDDLRRANLPGRWPYALYYRLLPDNAIVVAALHQRMNRARLRNRTP